MIKPHTLDFPPLHCSLDRALGDYYQDFSEAIQLVETGYHGGFDARGVPLLFLPGQGAFPNPVTTAQYALANLTAFRRGEQERGDRARVQLEWLIEAQEQDGEWSGCWLTRHDNPKYTWLRAPWTGALASGNAISALLRGWELFGTDAYRASAEAAYHALHVTHTSRSLHAEGEGSLWYEEYPADPGLHVLNGHVYTLFGVMDYARVSGDPRAERRWRLAASTALAHLDDFDLGYWSAYDLRWREPASLHYQKNIHVPQLRILAALTGEGRFAITADRWEGYLHSILARTRWAIGLRVRRFQRR